MSWSTPRYGLDFDAILDLAGRAAEGETRPEATWECIDKLLEAFDRSPDLQGPMAAMPAAALASLYTGEQGSRPAKPPPTDRESVARELRLAACASPTDLNRLRRLFAAANHPDRVAPASREEATRRMMLANMLIDEALARAKGAPP